MHLPYIYFYNFNDKQKLEEMTIDWRTETKKRVYYPDSIRLIVKSASAIKIVYGKYF